MSGDLDRGSSAILLHGGLAKIQFGGVERKFFGHSWASSETQKVILVRLGPSRLTICCSTIPADINRTGNAFTTCQEQVAVSRT